MSFNIQKWVMLQYFPRIMKDSCELFIRIMQDCFTCRGAKVYNSNAFVVILNDTDKGWQWNDDCTITSEVILMNMNKIGLYQTHTHTQQNVNRVHKPWDEPRKLHILTCLLMICVYPVNWLNRADQQRGLSNNTPWEILIRINRQNTTTGNLNVL